MHLSSPADLLQAPGTDVLLDSGRLISGMEEIILRLMPRRLRPSGRVVVVLPAHAVGARTQEELRRAVQRYCCLRRRQNDLRMRAQRRDGITAMGLGGFLFVVGLGLSYYFTQRTVPAPLQFFLGNGAFLVVAWVGLWYPLDVLAFARRALLRESRVLAAIEAMPLAVEVESPGAR